MNTIVHKAILKSKTAARKRNSTMGDNWAG